jgi:signal transduction histidine kinase
LPEKGTKLPRFVSAGLITAAVFAALATLTILVWRQQIQHQHFLLSQRTEEVCAQAARRLEVFMDLHLRVASIFARRWSTHETRDFSQRRFEEFASVLMKDLPGYYAVGLVPPDRSPGWVIPPEVPLFQVVLDPARVEVLDEVLRTGKAVLSEPFESAQGTITVYAVLPLRRGREFLGYLIADFRTKTLIEDCFHERIRSEFQFIIQDGGQILFRSIPGAAAWDFNQASTKSLVSFAIRNRTWRLDMTPRKEVADKYGWTANLPLSLLGIFLSVGLSILVLMLLRRMELLRAARDRQTTLSRKVLLAQEEERARISRELHDELGQQLTALRLEMGWMQRHISRESEDDSGAYKNAVLLVEQATEELRRMCRGLRPPLLDDLGLEPAILHLVVEFKRRLDCEFDVDISVGEHGESILQALALCTYRILQESLNNIRRHANPSRVTIRMVVTSVELTLLVSDDGEGFDVGQLGAMRGWGLQGMQERASLVDGHIEMQSSRGGGTRVFFRAPLNNREKER